MADEEIQQPEPEEIKLTYKQRRFVDAYVGEAKGNGTRAAIIVGYAEKGARVEAHRLLTNANIQAAIKERVSEYAMSPEEVLAEYADIARNASIMPLIGLALRNQNGKAVSRPYIELLDDDGTLKPEARFIKSVKFTTNAKSEEDSVAIELHDRMAALDRLAKYHGLQPDKHELSGPDGKPIETSSRANYTKLSTQELRELASLLAKAEAETDNTSDT
jgi:hypothetical protein